MKKYIFDKDIPVFYVEADSFPDGILAAHKKLHSLLIDANSSGSRRFFGISYLNGKGNIIYKAAAEEMHQGEAEKYACEKFTVRKGAYISETLIDWSSHVKSVEKTFKNLLAYPGIDINGYCLELYINDTDMICMVKLND
jgi:hypothetical protein